MYSVRSTVLTAVERICEGLRGVSCQRIVRTVGRDEVLIYISPSMILRRDFRSVGDLFGDKVSSGSAALAYLVLRTFWRL